MMLLIFTLFSIYISFIKERENLCKSRAVFVMMLSVLKVVRSHAVAMQVSQL